MKNGSQKERDARLGISYSNVSEHPSPTGQTGAHSVYDSKGQLVGIQAPAFRDGLPAESFGGFRPNSGKDRRSTLARR